MTGCGASMRSIQLVAVLFVFIGLVATTLGLSQSKTDEVLIREARARSNAAIKAHDIRAIVAELDSSYHITAGSGSFLESRDAMGEGFRSRFAEFSDAVYVRTAQTVKVAESGLLAFESGDWQGSWMMPAGPLRTGGSYAASWSRASGAWKIRSEVFVTLFCNGSGCS